MDARAQRALRAVAGTGTASIIAAVSHTVGGGTPPSPALIAAITLLTAPLAVLAVGPRLALWRVALTVIGCQAALHATFSVIGAPAPGTSARGGAHVHGAPMLEGVVAPLAAFAPTPGMLAAHVLAAIATIALLHRGEAALRALARFVWDVVAPPLAELPTPGARPVAPPSARRVDFLRSAAATAPILRRGPPPASRPQ